MDANKIKIAVCGDSRMCLDKYHVGTHFSELLSSQYSVVNLAKAGVSHVEIGFQLQQAIKLKPDYVFIGTTTSNRMEVPIGDTKNIKTLQLDHFRPGPGRYYISSNIQTLVDNSVLGNSEFQAHMTDERVDAVKKYLSYIYDDKLMTEINSWIMGYWLNQLRDAGIPHYVFDRTFLIYKETLLSPIYHTSYETQIRAAKWVNNYLDSIFKG
jgi:hypothetical protein